MVQTDVFLSFKNLDASGHATRDSQIAREVYEHLTKRGIEVFLSTVSLEQLGEYDYKKAIDEALDAASVMVAIGTSRENLEARRVRHFTRR